MEILFRGKKVDNGEWVEGYYAMCELSESVYIICDFFETIYTDRLEEVFCFGVNPETVGQFTGNSDIKKNKIFGGMILKGVITQITEKNKYEIPEFIKKIEYYSVEWVDHINYTGFKIYGRNRRFNKPLTRVSISNMKLEVAGNIHDNPELLED